METTKGPVYFIKKEELLIDEKNDFQRTARVLLNLIRVDLRMGYDDNAMETLRHVLIEASRIGMYKALNSPIA
jgi:hypothetical protein